MDGLPEMAGGHMEQGIATANTFLDHSWESGSVVVMIIYAKW